MEVSNEIKEDIRRSQSDLKNAIRVHQVWVARLQEDDTNSLYKCKVKEAEKDILIVSQTQKRVVERLRRELEQYQQRLKLRNKQVNTENDNRYVAQQLRDHQIQHRNKSRTTSLLKPSVLTEINIRSENTNGDLKASDDASDSETKLSNEASEGKENGNCSEDTSRDKYSGKLVHYPTSVTDSRNNFANALNKVKDTFMGGKLESKIESWQQSSELLERSDSDGSVGGSEPCPLPASPSPSPPPLPLPDSPHAVTQETFLRFLGLITPRQREALEKKRSERRKRCTTSTNRNEFVYGNFDMPPKRKKYNQFPYLQTTTPPQTRSQRLRKQQQTSTSREPSPTASSDNKGWSSNRAGERTPAWLATLPAGLTVEPVGSNKACAGCGRNDVPSLLVWCAACGVRLHTGCSAEGRCPSCRAPLPDPTHVQTIPHNQIIRDKLIERKRLQEKNIELCAQLRKLEARAAHLKDNMELHNQEKRELLASQIETQRNLQKLLDVMSQFKDTAISIQSTSASDSSSEISKGNDD